MKGKQHMWGELEGEKSKWALRKLAEMLSMRQPRFQGTQIELTTQTRGPPWAAVTNKPPLWNNEAANISLTVLNASRLRTMRRKESNENATVHATCTQIHKAKGQSYNGARSHLLWIIAIGCHRGDGDSSLSSQCTSEWTLMSFLHSQKLTHKSLALYCVHRHSDEARGLGPTSLGKLPVFW